MYRLLIPIVTTFVIVPCTFADIICTSCPASGIVDVVADCGADPEDSASLDDTEIAAALGLGCKVVYFPPGTYNISGAVVEAGTNPPAVLRGEGRESSILKLEAAGAEALLAVSDVPEIRIEGLAFDGDDLAGTGALLKLVDVVHLVVSDCELRRSSGHGLHIALAEGTQTAFRGLVENGYAHHNDGYGFYVDSIDRSFIDALRFETSHAEGNNGGGFGAQSWTGITYAGCTSTQNQDSAGFNIDSSSLVAYTGCISSGNQTGFASDDSSDITYAACIAGSNDSDGFDITSTQQVSLAGCDAYGNQWQGITLEESEHFSVSGGVIRENLKNGIYIKNSSYGAVNGATIISNEYDGIRLYAVGTLVFTRRVVIVGSVATNEAGSQQPQNYGINVKAAGGGKVKNISVFNNMVTGNEFDGVRLDACDECQECHNH